MKINIKSVPFIWAVLAIISGFTQGVNTIPFWGCLIITMLSFMLIMLINIFHYIIEKELKAFGSSLLTFIHRNNLFNNTSQDNQESDNEPAKQSTFKKFK